MRGIREVGEAGNRKWEVGSGKRGYGLRVLHAGSQRGFSISYFPFPISHFPFPYALLPISISLLSLSLFPGCASWNAASAEEYYSIGMAYFDLGKYTEAEKWLLRAQSVDKTKIASEYTLGRIAFETGRFEEAVEHFERILRRDPANVMALKAAAYSRIKTGDLERAEDYYDRVLELVPESADDGYNYALVLYALGKYAELEEVLSRYAFALEENKDLLLLLARAQKAQGKVEAIDTYAKWLAVNNDPKVQYEYAQCLDQAELFARALEEYRKALESLPQNSEDPKRPVVQAAIARVLLIADPENEEGIRELKTAVEQGYDDQEALEKLLLDRRLSDAGRKGIETAITDIERGPPPPSEVPALPKASPPDLPPGSPEIPPDSPDLPPNPAVITPVPEVQGP